MPGIRITRQGRQPSGTPGSPRRLPTKDWFDDFDETDDWCKDQMAITRVLEQRVKEVRDGLRAECLKLHPEERVERSVRLEEDLPRTLWLLQLHRAVIEDSDMELVEFGGVFIDEDDAPLPEATLLLERDDGTGVCVSVYAGEECLGGADLDLFLDEARWRELTMRWLIHELNVEPSSIKTTVRAALPKQTK